MNIYIMSRGRHDKVNTIKWIPRTWRDQVFLVVPESEAVQYEVRYGSANVIRAPAYVTNYSEKFQWILDGIPRLGHSDDKAIILDDDLVFSNRSDPKAPNSLISIRDPEATLPMWERIEALLEEYALVGVHPRQMG